VRLEADGSWTVFDILTGWPADHDGLFLDGFDKSKVIVFASSQMLSTNTTAGCRPVEAHLFSSIAGPKYFHRLLFDA
jgi:hypothetical protein